MLTGVRLSFCTLRFCNIIDANMFHCSRPKVDTKFERCFLFLNFPQQSRCTSIFQNTSEERWAILAQNVVVVVVCHSYYFGTILFSVQNFGTNLTVSLMYLDHPYLFYTGCLADVGDIILSGVRMFILRPRRWMVGVKVVTLLCFSLLCFLELITLSKMV